MDLLDDQLNELDNMLDDGEDDWMHIEHPMAIHWRDIGLIIKIAWSEPGMNHVIDSNEFNQIHLMMSNLN